MKVAMLPPMIRGRQHGFTLLEICLAIMIGLLIISLSVPSISGVLAEQRLKESFAKVDELVRKAQERAASERRTFVIVWEQEGIALKPMEPNDEDQGAEVQRVAMAEGETLTIERPAALEQKPSAEWAFWRSGLCEPAIISYDGPDGTWKVEYNALTGRGTFLDQDFK